MSNVDIHIPRSIDRLLPSQNRAKDILNKRDTLFIETIPAFTELAGQIATIFNNYIDGKDPRPVTPDSEEIPKGATRETYAKFFNSKKGRRVVELWFGKGMSFDKAQSEKKEALTAILYGLNKVKVFANGHVEPKFRKGKVGGLDVPYGMHTHVELPYFLRQYGLGGDTLTTALAVNHDTTEEGIRVLTNSGLQTVQEAVNTNQLIRKFPTDNLGKGLAVGIQVLTESEMPEIGPDAVVQMQADRGVANTVTKARNTFPKPLEPHAKQVDQIAKNYVEDPLVFGGLALQVTTAVRKLKNEKGILSQQKRKELGAAIISVEMADRMGDIAGLTRLMDNTDYTPTYGRQRVLLYVCRMLNMLEKLQEGSRDLGLRRKYADAFSGYKNMLAVRVAQVNSQLAVKKLPALTTSEIQRYYDEEFLPLQKKADEIMQPLVARKVDRILKGAQV